ncbi:unnamed protein product [Schistosoma curassoni]|uniref:Ion_trans domain-containing protein n=1 Tax=Schistosoma curassoni TaxID=6186 RepID=A0A183KJE4_9TREM|nr:unnamed protein product [Schistosoma curassoni]
MVSYLTFLILITVATFRLDRTAISDGEDNWEVRYTEILSYDFRTSHVVMTKIQIILLFWILGQLCMECKQVYHYGLRYFFRSYYNFMDWVSIALYLASYSLRIIVDFKVQASMRQYQDVLKVAQSILLNTTCSTSKFCSSTEQTTHQNYVNYRNKILIPESAYWLRGCRLWWAPDDPEYISDCLFALGNVLSFSRISYLMPAWELLGPLQISLARMVSDIIRFMALFTVVSDFSFAWDDNLFVSTHGLKRKWISIFYISICYAYNLDAYVNNKHTLMKVQKLCKTDHVIFTEWLFVKSQRLREIKLLSYNPFKITFCSHQLIQ